MPDEGINLSLIKVDCGDVSKTGMVLIEKISTAIGAVFLPWQIERVAKAEGKAELIKTGFQIEATELQRRAAQRVVAEEIKRQQNIENVTRKALPNVSENANPAAIDDDWIGNFFDKCRSISDDQMQALWAKVLAGEANAPGAFSRRAVNFLADMDSADAELFTTLCSYSFGSGHETPMILDTDHPIYTECGIDPAALRHLQSIGLLIYEQRNVISLQPCDEDSTFELEYFGRTLATTTPGAQLDVGHVTLTAVGKQLASISGATEIPGFYDFVIQSLAGWAIDPCTCV